MIYFYKIYGFCGTASPLILSYGTSFIKKMTDIRTKTGRCSWFNMLPNLV